MTESSRLGSRLNEVLSGLEMLIVSDERAAEHDRIVRDAQEAEARGQRLERLQALDIELSQSVHRKIVHGAGLKATTSLRAVQRWLPRPDLKPTLVLVGDRGCGKSVACAWAVANFSGSECWQTASELIRTFTPTFGDALKAQDRVKRSQLTVLDDIATEGDAVRMCAALIEILEKRKQRKTLITTNLSLEDWKKRYPDTRLHSRLSEQAIFVADNGPDLRLEP